MRDPTPLATVEAVPRRYLPQREAAAYLAISPRALWTLSAPRGPVPVVRIGGRIVYDIADLDTFAAANKVQPAD